MNKDHWEDDELSTRDHHKKLKSLEEHNEEALKCQGQLCKCRKMREYASKFEMGKYYILMTDKQFKNCTVDETIDYCPWCGIKLPDDFINYGMKCSFNLGYGDGIACPMCGEELYDTGKQVRSFPPQFQIYCKKCSYDGWRY